MDELVLLADPGLILKPQLDRPACGALAKPGGYTCGEVLLKRA
jgi:hypothetical protein